MRNVKRLWRASAASAVVVLAKILREAGYQDVGSGTVSVSGTGVEAATSAFPTLAPPPIHSSLAERAINYARRLRLDMSKFLKIRRIPSCGIVLVLGRDDRRRPEFHYLQETH
jgi:hypothetical protein